MGNAGSILHGTPAFGEIEFAKDVSAADIANAKGTWVGEWKDMNAQFEGPVQWGTPATTPTSLFTQRMMSALMSKRHFPVGGVLHDTTATVTIVIQGRHGPNDHDIQTLHTAVVNNTNVASVLAGSDGTASGAANHRSQQKLTGISAIPVYPQMRVVISGFVASLAGEVAANTGFRSWPTADGSSLADYTPVGITKDATNEGLQLILPACEPWVTEEGTGRLTYPVLMHVRSSGTIYNQIDAATAGGAGAAILEAADANAIMAHEALKAGWAVVSIILPGINNTVRTDPVFWRQSNDYSLGTDMDPRKNIAWAHQYTRAVWAQEYALNPKMLFTWGELDGFTQALWSAFGGETGEDLTSAQPLRRTNSLPNLIGGRNPEVEWRMMDSALRCPLGTTDGSAPAVTLVSTGGAPTTDASSVDILSLALIRKVTLKAIDAGYLARIRQIPYFIVADGSATFVTGSLTTDVAQAPYIPGVATDATYGYLPNYSLGVIEDLVTVQSDDLHCYMLAYAFDVAKGPFDQFTKWTRGRDDAGGPGSHFHVQAAASLPAAGTTLRNLVTSSGDTTDAVANVRALRWAEQHFKIATRAPGAQAHFSVRGYL